MQTFLNNWINQLRPEPGRGDPGAEGRLPLREARIEVTEDKAKPGSYKAVAYLRPHFQLEELKVSLRLVADLPQAAK